jgi:hypothetical protein
MPRKLNKIVRSCIRLWYIDRIGQGFHLVLRKLTRPSLRPFALLKEVAIYEVISADLVLYLIRSVHLHHILIC